MEAKVLMGFLTRMLAMSDLPTCGAAAGGVAMGFAFFLLGFGSAMLICCLLQPGLVTAEG
jgi:CRISPR/Cas system-associated protein endoribonuclease Cas2